MTIFETLNKNRINERGQEKDQKDSQVKKCRKS